MKNLEIAKIFERMADVLALLEENSFRILAYKKISRVLEELPEAVEKLAEQGKLETVPGIGKSSAERIEEYLRTGKIGEFEELLGRVPAGVLQMIKIPSVGPKTAALLWHEGGVTSVEDLKARIESEVAGKATGLMNIKGLGEKKLKKIAENLAHLATSSGRIRLGEALPIAETFVTFLRALPGVVRAEYCGSLRRGKETIGDIDIAVAAGKEHAAAIGEAVTKHVFAAGIIQVGESKTSIRTGNGVQIDVRVVPVESFGAALQYFTGSQAHNVKLREMAIKMGLKVNEWGVYRVEAGTETKIAGETEEGVYAALGLACMPPEMREDRGEVENAKRDTRHAKPGEAGAKRVKKATAKDKAVDYAVELVEVQDIRGDLHMHTTASDGARSIEEMVAEGKRRGYQYVAITDHSKSQFQANGLKADRLLEHIEKIHAVARAAAKSGMLVLAGSEVDILADGSLDYEDDLLAKLDWVVASPHAALSQESDAATQRLVRAASNPYVCVIGHPTGRIVPSRRGLEPDMAKVIFAAARNGVAMEINANYHRLDLRDTHVKMAVEAGVPVCIDTDAHSLEEFDQIRYGVLTARRGWATKADVLNTRTADELKKWLAARKEMAGW
jgi:DNA polymerase (family 10)